MQMNIYRCRKYECMNLSGGLSFVDPHIQWLSEISTLRSSLSELTDTAPDNVYQHFFLRVVGAEFSKESEARLTFLKQLIHKAVENRHQSGSVRARAANILSQLAPETILQKLRLADIRNVVVFTILKHCNITVDTYFGRYSSPPGSVEENEYYSAIAHGNAIASAEKIERVETLLISMQILKRFFIVYDYIQDDTIQFTPLTLNWVGNMWAVHIQEKKLDDLIWTLFLDLFYYEKYL